MQRPVICWRSCRINSTLCWMNSVASLAPGKHYCDPCEADFVRLTHRGGWLEHFLVPWAWRIAEHFHRRKRFLCCWHLFSVIVDSSGVIHTSHQRWIILQGKLQPQSHISRMCLFTLAQLQTRHRGLCEADEPGADPDKRFSQREQRCYGCRDCPPSSDGSSG